MNTRVEITPRTILFVFALVAGVWFILAIHDILLLLLIAFIIMSAVLPLVRLLMGVGIPRTLSIVLTYLLVICVFVLFSTFVIPPFISQSLRLFNNLPDYFGVISPYIKIDFTTVVEQVAPLGQNVVKLITEVFSNILAFVTVLVFSFYFTLERNRLGEFVESLVGEVWRKRFITIMHRIEEQMGAWVRGQLILMFAIGMFAFIGLSIFGVNYALPLALFAGILEAVPVIGPNISAIPAILVALNSSYGLAIWVAILYFVIQQVENTIVVPLVLRKTVGVPPLVSLLALLIGARFAGILGAVLAIPVFLIIRIIFEEMTRKS